MINSPMTYMGLKITINDVVMSEMREDWSNVRSYSRALRRRKRGFKQNVINRLFPKQEFIRFGDTIVMHSEIYKKLLKQTEENKNAYNYKERY